MTVDRKRATDTCPTCLGACRFLTSRCVVSDSGRWIDLYRECPTCGGTGTVPSTSAKSGRNRSA